MGKWDRLWTGLKSLSSGLDSILHHQELISRRLARIERNSRRAKTKEYWLYERHAFLDEWVSREDQEAAIKRALASRLAEQLLEAGVIEILEEREPAVVPGPIRPLRSVEKGYIAKITVVMPGRDED